MLVHLCGVRFFVHRGVARWIGVPYVLQVACSSRDWEDSYPVVLAVKDRAKFKDLLGWILDKIAM